MVGVDRTTIVRYETRKKPPITKQMIARIGMELKLEGAYTEDMMRKAKCDLDYQIREDNELRFVINFLYPIGVEAGNAYLLAKKCPTLGSRKKNLIN